MNRKGLDGEQPREREEGVDRRDETLPSSSFSANEFSHEYVSTALITEFIVYRAVRSWRTEVVVVDPSSSSIGRSASEEIRVEGGDEN